jgi:cleavage stimulation factor subunit 2
VTDRETGKLKGFGFCEFMDLAVAESAKRNLNGREYNGRQLRVDFAGDGDAAAEKKSEKPQGAAATPLHYDTPMGSATASSAQQQMHAAGLGGGGMDAVTARLAEMSPAQLFSVMNQLKTLTQQNQSQARQLLVSNPQLTLALFQAQLALGMTKPPAAMAAAAAPAPPPGVAGGAPLPPPPGGYRPGMGVPGMGVPGNAPASGRPGDAAVRGAAVPAAASQAGDGGRRASAAAAGSAGGGGCRGPATAAAAAGDQHDPGADGAAASRPEATGGDAQATRCSAGDDVT